MKILYVEDDPTARQFVHKGLSSQGFVVDVAKDGIEGFDFAISGSYDLLIVDIILPKRDGFELLRELREQGVSTPALFLSARQEVGDRVRGLNLGADDYLTKPFAFAELLARIRAIGRRLHHDPEDGCLRVADLTLDLNRNAVTRADRPIELTPKEFALLTHLVRNAGHVISRTMVLEKVWGHGFDSYSNLVDVHINHLRKKIDRAFQTKLIHTVKGVGYIFEDRSAPGESGR